MKTIIEMAREAGFEVDEDIANVWVSDAYIGDKLERFAELVRADEREAIESEGWCDTEIVIAAIKEALAQPAQEPVAYAGVKVWVGNQQVVRLLTQTELHYAVEPWLLVELNALKCIASLKEKNT